MELVIYAVGNDSRGDDALGPLLLQRVEGLNLPRLHTVLDYQLQIEHALELDGRGLALFLDAGQGTPAPYHFYPTQPAIGSSFTTHTLSPEALLAVYQRVEGRLPPPAFVLCVRGEGFELGAPLSQTAATHLEEAWAFLRGLLAQPDADSWRARSSRTV